MGSGTQKKEDGILTKQNDFKNIRELPDERIAEMLSKVDDYLPEALEIARVQAHP